MKSASSGITDQFIPRLPVIFLQNHLISVSLTIS
jgi:hypothetical protein